MKEELLNQLEQFKRYVDLDPSNENLLVDTIGLAFQTESWNDLRKLVDLAIEQDIINGLISGQKGYLLLIDGEYQQASYWLEKALEFDQNNANVKYNLAYSKLFLMQPKESIEILKPLNPDSYPLAYTLKARANYLLGDLQLAKELLIKGLDVLDGQARLEALALLSLVEYDNDNLEYAYKLASDVLTEDEIFEASLAKASVAMEWHENDEAKRIFHLLSEKYSGVGRVWAGLATVLFNEFDLDNAHKSATKATELIPEHIGSWHLLGWILMIQGLPSEALKMFEAAYQLDRGFADTHGGIASAYAMLGNNEMSERHLKLAKRLNPDSKAYLFAQFAQLQQKGKLNEAKNLLNTTTKINVPSINVTLGSLVENKIKTLQKKK
ncbi:tetratricopeptide repeat protein [Catenovulum sediminis]|uniref:tetratricopeptide repeat protein n=1 Tax=Catenovulum sediminis TaxID=1740262 RepID=UPI0011807581|nr:tetratricopeptide repeat protein [Catenovulum sediminis]